MNYQAHLFLCTNDRGPDGKRPSCAHRGAEELRAGVKEACRWKGFPKGAVRVNGAGCLDQCERGVTAVLYPSGEWFQDLGPQDVDKLVAAVEKAVNGDA